ncbi:MAG TPA: hypothetical protein EYQ26_16145 [Rhodospirillales bacterium]|jgi:hypothetical protein|nr:hypothetical protein [Rhodospirillales bacterium]
MRTDLERGDFLALLEKLKSEEDDEVLGVVRDINAKMTVAGVSWDDLLISQDETQEDSADDDKDEDGQESGRENVSDDNSEPLNDEERQEAENLINAIKGMKVSEATKQEIDEYRDDLREGEFEQMDLRYLRALKARLSV